MINYYNGIDIELASIAQDILNIKNEIYSKNLLSFLIFENIIQRIAYSIAITTSTTTSTPKTTSKRKREEFEAKQLLKRKRKEFEANTPDPNTAGTNTPDPNTEGTNTQFSQSAKFRKMNPEMKR